MALNHIYETQFIMWVQLSQFLSPMRDFSLKLQFRILLYSYELDIKSSTQDLRFTAMHPTS